MNNNTLENFTKIETNLVYPDGDEVIIYFGQNNENYVLTDFGDLYCFPWMPYKVPEKESKAVQVIMNNFGIQIKKGCFFKEYVSTPTEKEIDQFCKGILEIANYWFEEGRGYKVG